MTVANILKCARTSITIPSSLHPNTEVSSIHWRVEGRHGSHQGALTSS